MVSANSPTRVEAIIRAHMNRPEVAFFMATITHAFRS